MREFFCPHKIIFRANDKFEFGIDIRELQITRVERAGFAAIGGFDVNYLFHPGIHLRATFIAAGFERHVEIQIAQLNHERINRRLQQRLTARNTNISGGIALCLFNHLIHAQKMPLMVRIFRVTIVAAQMTTRRADKDGRVPYPGGFALNAKKNLIDFELIV